MFQLVFFIVVEVPSMIVMTIHKLLMTAKGREFTLLPIWVYRCIGFVGWLILFPIAVAFVALDARYLRYLLWILVAAIVVLMVIFLRRASTGVGSPLAESVGPVAPAYIPLLKPVRDQASLAIVQSLPDVPGARPDPNTAALASDLAAALQFYALSGADRVSVAQIRDFFDRDPTAVIDAHLGPYAQRPPSPDRDWAVNVLNHCRPLASSPTGANVLALTRIALGRAAQGYR